MTAASGSALPGELATKWMDEFGDNLYNLYGSTEVAWATIATPRGHARRARHGRQAAAGHGDPDRRRGRQRRRPGETGRIFIGNQLAFEGYTGGGDKEHLGDLLSSGDVGHFDEDGRLFIDGRDDEMIVSGGENVFPREIEDLLSDHEAVERGGGDRGRRRGLRPAAGGLRRQGRGRGVSEEDLKDHVKQNLARYKVPREIVFLDELPRNATGKVLKRELAERAARRLISPSRLEDPSERRSTRPVPRRSGFGAKALRADRSNSVLGNPRRASRPRLAEAAAESMRAAAGEAIERARRVEQDLTAKAREAIQTAGGSEPSRPKEPGRARGGPSRAGRASYERRTAVRTRRSRRPLEGRGSVPRRRRARPSSS